jgi:wobble nucleotide-excising tRNase
LVDNDNEGQRGQYQILGHNGDIRPVTELSKGERNIIAYLYFVFSLEGVGRGSKPRIIVLDDPMTSNDDAMQYLMTDQVRHLRNAVNSRDSYLLLLTHNLHFYLNVRPSFIEAEQDGIIKRNKNRTDPKDMEKTFFEKNGYFVLQNNGTHTAIKQITARDEDFKTSYAALWDDLAFLYFNDRPASMLTNCRRIVETYMKFNACEGSFYKKSEFVRKLFNVNAHSIDDHENELNGKTRDEIIHMLRGLFKEHGAEDHFKIYWRRKEDQ